MRRGHIPPILSCYSLKHNETAHHHQPPLLRFGDVAFVVAPPNDRVDRALAALPGFDDVAFAVALPNTEFTETSFGAEPKSTTIFVSLQETTFPSTAVVRAHRPQPQVLGLVTEVPEPFP